jgi:translation initiation factor IF-3
VERFLNEGSKVKITIMFRGREMAHPELGKKILDRIAEQVKDVGNVEAAPRVDGRNMLMVLAPVKKQEPKGTKPPRPPASEPPAAAPSPSAESVPASPTS